jgi:DNA replication and repair protein RecF
MALYGAHRDKYSFAGKNGEVAVYYSTGQRRALAIALKIASTTIIAKNLPKLPIILIDDIFLELEDKLSQLVVNLMPSYQQAFFTFLPQHKQFGHLSNALHYTVEHGELYVQ